MHDASWPVVKAVMESHAARHRECHEALGEGPVGKCAACGLTLLFDDRCPEHWAADRVEWTEEHERAAVAFGAEAMPVLPADANASNVWVQVRRLLERWAERGELVEATGE